MTEAGNIAKRSATQTGDTRTWRRAAAAIGDLQDIGAWQFEIVKDTKKEYKQELMLVILPFNEASLQVNIPTDRLTVATPLENCTLTVTVVVDCSCHRNNGGNW